MVKYIKQKLMDFRDLFKDGNDLNEKNIVGFASFTIMIIFAIADIISGWVGDPLNINQFIFDSFVWVTLGSFGISEVSKAFGNRKGEK